jgi:hypothetical protein
LTLFFSRESTLTIIGRDEDASVAIWQPNSNQFVSGYPLRLRNAHRLMRALVTPEGKCVVGISNETMAMPFQGIVTTVPHEAYGQALTVSADGHLAATCGDNEDGRPVVLVWSLPDLRERWRCNLLDIGCRDIACALAFSRDGRHLIVAGWDGVMRRLVMPRI